MLLSSAVQAEPAQSQPTNQASTWQPWNSQPASGLEPLLIPAPQPAPTSEAPPSPSAAMYPNMPISTSIQTRPDYFYLQKKIYRWNDKTKLVLVHISQAPYFPDWNPWNIQIVKDAFATWQRALDNRVMFVFMKDPSQADVMVQWWNTATADVEHGASGVNRLQIWGKYIAKNDIYLSLHNNQRQPWPPQTLYTTALHEIGHMLGIQEHSDDPADIMYRSLSTQTMLSARDINTMKRIYSSKAHFTNPPGYHLAQFEAFKKTQKNTGFWIPIFLPIPL